MLRKLFRVGALVALVFMAMLGGCSLLDNAAQNFLGGKVVHTSGLMHVSAQGVSSEATQPFFAGDRLELELEYAQEVELTESTVVRVKFPDVTGTGAAHHTWRLVLTSARSSRFHKLSYTITSDDAATLSGSGAFNLVAETFDLTAIGYLGRLELKKILG